MQKSVKEDRQKWIGGSDIPAIMGISPFTTRYELLLLKADIKENTFEGNEYTEYGNVMEPKIRDYINTKYSNIYTEFKETKHINEDKGYRCHLDGENEDSVLEIKTTSQIHSNINEYEVYLVQLLFYMINSNKRLGVLAVYERPEDFSEQFDEDRLTLYNISINDYEELCNKIMEAVEQFKVDLEKLKENPLLSEEDLLPTPIYDLSNEIVAIENQLVQYQQLKTRQEKLKEQLKIAMKENSIKSWETPNGTLITLTKDTPDKEEIVFNEDKFSEEHPDMFKEYCETKIKKGRSGYIKITLRDKNED